MRLGKHEKEMLRFSKLGGTLGYFNISEDRTTQRAAKSLARKGLLVAYYSTKKPTRVNGVRPLYEGE